MSVLFLALSSCTFSEVLLNALFNTSVADHYPNKLGKKHLMAQIHGLSMVTDLFLFRRWKRLEVGSMKQMEISCNTTKSQSADKNRMKQLSGGQQWKHEVKEVTTCEVEK